MDDELTLRYRRWLAADESASEDEADAACRAVFEVLQREDEGVPVTFSSRTMQAIAAGTALSARRARRTRRVLTAGGILTAGVAAYFGGGVAVAAASTMVVSVLNLFVGLIVNSAAGVQAGADLWSLLATMGRAASAFVSDPKVTFVLLVLQAFAIGALVTLQRLLGSDRESLK